MFNHTSKKDVPKTEIIAPSTSFVNLLLEAEPSNFHLLCSSLGISNSHLEKWQVGAKGKFTAFVLRNFQGETVNVKFVAYTSEGKRDKSKKHDGSPVYIPHYLGKAYLKSQNIERDQGKLNDWQEYYKFPRCFYGAHLWNREKDTCIVESEKTAVISSFFFPQYNWLATGGINGMTFEQFEIFYSYTGRIWNIVDNDKAGYQKSKTILWLDRLAEMRSEKNEILSINLFPNSKEGWDLADAIIYDNYRDEKQFDLDLRRALDCRIEFEFNLESGEVNEIGFSKPSEVSKKDIKRAAQVADRIFEGKVNLLIRQDVNTADLMESLASLGEAGRLIAYKVWEAAGMPNEEADALFDTATLKGQFKYVKSGLKYFFARAKAAGVETRLIKTARLEAAEGADWIETEKWTIKWPGDLEMQSSFDELQYREDIFTYSFIEYKNCIWFAVFDFGNMHVGFHKISNFVIRPLYLIKSKTDPKRLFEIKNIYGVKYILDIPAKALVSMTEFQVFCESHGNFLFEGTKAQFTKIKRKLYDLTKDAEEVKTLGWQDEGFYAFANGVYQNKFTQVDEFGIIKHLVEKNDEEAEEKYFFIPAMSNIYRDEKELYEMEKKFVYVHRPDVKFADWAQLFYDTYGDNGVIGMCYYISSLFRDLVYSRFKFFPHLFHFGPPGTGKSTMCWSIQFMFGLERKPFMLNAGTAVGFHRTFAQFRNAVVWFDEYNNSIEFKRVQDLKSAYDGAGHVKGEWSNTGGSTNKTITTPVESACNISGQELPTADNALFKRCILLQYYQTIFSDEEKKTLTRLQKLQEKGLSHITGAIMTLRTKMESEYFPQFDVVEAELIKALDKDVNIESRIVKNMAVVATTYKVLERELPWPFNWKKMLEIMVYNIKEQNKLISNAKETSLFWDAVDYCINNGELKDGDDFKIQFLSSVKITVDKKKVERQLDKTQKVLFIRIATAHPKYMEALKRQGEKKGMDKGSLSHYLSHSPGFIGMVSSTRFKSGDKQFTSNAYAFEYRYLEDQGYNFDRFDEESGEPTVQNAINSVFGEIEDEEKF